MEDMNTSLNEKEIASLSKLISKKLYSISYEEFYKNFPSIFMRLGLNVGNKFYILDNRVDVFDNYFAQPDFIPHFTFNEVKDESQFTEGISFIDFKTYKINEKIIDIILIQDHLEIFRENKHLQYWNSTEGVIIETAVRQYAYYKENTCFDESILIYKGHKVLSKLEPIVKHWYIFGEPCNANVTREYISLTKGKIKGDDSCTIIGEKNDGTEVKVNREAFYN